MIVGVHAIVFSPAADEVRAFFGDVLRFDSVDAGGGWPIFALPPAELAVHPDAGTATRSTSCATTSTRRWPSSRPRRLARPAGEPGTMGPGDGLALPGGSEIALYEPSHPGPVRDRRQRGPPAG